MRYFYTVFLIFAFSKCVFSQIIVPPRNDNQSWNDVQLVLWSDKKNEVAINGVLRIGGNFSRFTDERIGISYTHKPSKYFSLTGSYLYRASQPFKGRKAYENRFTTSATVNVPLGNKFELHNLNQIEYKSLNARPNVWEYRNRLRLDREVSVNGYKITPFVSGEAFYNITTKDWYRSRFAAGIGRKFGKKFSGEIYYMRQNDGVSRPGNLNILGTSLKIVLHKKE